MNAKLIANAFVVTSSVTAEEYNKLREASSDARFLYEGEGETRKPVFTAVLVPKMFRPYALLVLSRVTFSPMVNVRLFAGVPVP